MFYTKFNSGIWKVVLAGDFQGIASMHLMTGDEEFEIPCEWILNPAFFADAEQQVLEYFRGERKIFDLKLNPEGTEFQKKVWQALRDIPYGHTATYKDIALAVDSPKAFRAVGLANSKNPIPVIIPCHRVIGTNGKLTGFALGLEAKERLLDLEKEFA